MDRKQKEALIVALTEKGKTYREIASRCCLARTELPNTALHSSHHAAKFLLYIWLGNILPILNALLFL